MTDILEPSYRHRIGYQAGLLGGFTMLAATVLVMGHGATEDAIARRQADDLRAGLSQVVPADRYDNDLLSGMVTVAVPNAEPRVVYRALKENVVTAIAYQITGPGYAGPIALVMGVDRSGTLLGVRVLSHSETPGLGDKIEIQRDPWILSFNGLSLSDPDSSGWAVKKDGGRFDQFTGATITPRAVVNIVKRGLVFFAEHKTSLLAATAALEEITDEQ